jgi:hypothetical protein
MSQNFYKLHTQHAPNDEVLRTFGIIQERNRKFEAQTSQAQKSQRKHQTQTSQKIHSANITVL